MKPQPALAPVEDLLRRQGNVSIAATAALGAASLCIAAAVITATFFWTKSYTDGFRAAADQSWHRLMLVERLDNHIMSTSRELRAALEQDDPALLDGYRKSLDAMEQAASALRQETIGDPMQESQMRGFDEALLRWRTFSAVPAISYLSSAGRGGEALEQGMQQQLLRELAPPVDRMRAVLNELRTVNAELLQQRTQAYNDAWRDGGLAVVVAFALALLLAVLGLVTIRRNAVEPLATLIGLIPRLLAGETTLPIPYADRQREVGAFARALLELREAVRERQNVGWLRQEVEQLSVKGQMAATHEQFAETLLQSLCSGLSAGYGLAYRWDDKEGCLICCGAYGLPERAAIMMRLESGQGLVGQSVVERKLLVREEVPPGHFQVLTGLGSAPPSALIVLPLIARGDVVGVIELGLMRPPGDDDLRLLGAAEEMAALIWHTLGRSLSTLDLLRTTQSQADELRASQEAMRIQQEELRTTNETLRDRTELLEEQKRRLKSSEEELRAQTEELRIANTTLSEKSDTLRVRQEELELSRQQLEARARELETTSRYKSEFLANMSHELRTPLNSLLILSKSLADNEGGNLDADELESAQIVYESGKNLLNLINDILDLSKIEAGKMQLVLEDVNLDEFLAMQERNFRHVANSRGLHFEIIKERGLPEQVHSDGTRMGQIIVNLLSNAFKFTQEGDVTLTVGRPNAASTVRMPGLDPTKAVYFAVTDTGIGIPEAKVDHIFQPFEQADGGTSRRFGGTGLGLSIVRGMAQLLGGEVQVQSEEGVGSMFMLIIPEQLVDTEAYSNKGITEVAEAVLPTIGGPAGPASRHPRVAQTQGASVKEAALRVPQGSHGAILIVEDDPAFSRILASIVQRRGAKALTAATGDAALKLAAQETLSGVLLDLGLPDMSGWEVLQRLKSDTRTRHIPVHIISANDESTRGLAMGAVGFLVKPATREAVLNALDRVAHFGEGRRRRVLLVDDDAGSRLSVRRLLADDLVDLVEAHDAAAALSALAQPESFDCVILDLGLPDLSGFELLERAAKLGNLPPVVVYSGRELTPDESLRLREHTESIVIKGARSPERLLDEVSLFLHAIRPPQPAPPPVRAPVMEADIAGKTVLVVDDDMRNVFALSKSLRTRGLKVLMAQDGYKALAQMETNPEIDVVLMDIMMPGMDGYETIRRIRMNEAWKDVPIIAVTAKAMKGDREKCLEVGANDYCAKPIDVDQLMSQLRVWI